MYMSPELKKDLLKAVNQDDEIYNRVYGALDRDNDRRMKASDRERERTYHGGHY